MQRAVNGSSAYLETHAASCERILVVVAAVIIHQQHVGFVHAQRLHV